MGSHSSKSRPLIFFFTSFTSSKQGERERKEGGEGGKGEEREKREREGTLGFCVAEERSTRCSRISVARVFGDAESF